MGKFIDITGQTFGNWSVLSYNKELKQWLCECNCEKHTKKYISSADLRRGKTTNCGCKRKKDLTGQQFGHLIVDNYAGEYHWNCHCVICNRQFNVHTYHLEHNNIPACNHNDLHTNVVDITGKQFNDWTVLSYAGNKYWNCRCSCGIEKKVLGKALRTGTSKSCGHNYNIKPMIYSNKSFKDLTGQQFGEWTVLNYECKQKFKCKCSCGKTELVHSYALRSRKSKSCGHDSGKLKDITGQIFGELTVIEYAGKGKWKCKCSCGNTVEASGKELRSGRTKSCGRKNHKHEDISGKKFFSFEPFEYIGLGRWKCLCDCGNIRVKTVTDLKYGNAKSCGCRAYEYRNESMVKIGIFNERTPEQIAAVKSAENLRKFIGDNEYTVLELSKALNINHNYASKLCKMYGLYDIVIKNAGNSHFEDDIYNYICSIYNGKITRHDRKILHGKELDIYIPEKSIAIEFNGTYWHCDELVDKKYHQNKTIECIKNNIQLIHIFEYEWVDNNKQKLIKSLIKDRLCSNIIYYARQLDIKYTSKDDEVTFLNNYHLQGYVASETALGLYHNNELFGIMTFGKPRFNERFDCELLRMCFKTGVNIVGGSEKLLKHYINKHKPKGIVSYCDLSKFSGNSYIRLGFKTDKSMLTQPNYVWVSTERNEKLSRYQTQKSKLIKNGLGTYGNTESEIMSNLNYLRVYDSGNMRFEMNLD